MHTLDLDEHKEQDRENARRTLAKEFILMTSSMYSKREYREYRKYLFKALPEGIYIWFSLLYLALPDITIYYI